MRYEVGGRDVKITVEQITPLPQGLVMGCQVRGPKDSWVKFVLVRVPYAEIPPSAIDAYWKWWDRDERELDEDQALPLDWG